MGVAIFAARKIALLNSINNLEMMRMQISSQQQVLTDQACNLSMQQMNLQMTASMMPQQGGGGNVWNQIGQAAGGLGGSVGSLFGGQGAGIGSLAGSVVGLAGSIFGGGGGDGGSAAAQQQQQQMQQQNMQIQMKLMQIQQQEKRLEMTAKTLETQLLMKNKELEGVEKGEEKAIARSGPKFE
ncbi:MAG: hypothetical protein WCF95_05600 [bacterium]